MKNNTFEKIALIVSKIPRGKVASYGQIADRYNQNNTGIISPKIVGFAMHANKDPKNVPCHRVVMKDGSLSRGYAFGSEEVQRKILQSEAVEFVNKKVDISFFIDKLA